MKGVIYARYSSDNQREESIEGQLRECKDYAERNGITILGTYIDRALSAKTDNRPEFQKMIKDSAKGLFDVVLVWKLDRFARNRYDSARYKNLLKKNGVKVISARENISEGSEGIILEAMLEGYAEYYSAELSEKVIRGLTDNALKCKYNGGTVPMGYYIDEQQFYQIDPKTAPVVLEMFTKYSEGATMQELVNLLNSRGMRSIRGGKITLNIMNHLLKNRRYMGEYSYRDVVKEDGIPAIVPKELFERVQERLAKNKKAPARHKAEDDYLLTTKLYCGKCGSFMVGESGTSHTMKVHRYYRCVNTKKKKLCDKKAVKKDWIEDLVVNYTMKAIMNDEVMERLIDTLMELQKKESTDLPLLKKQLAETEKGINNMLNAIQAGIFTPSTKQRLDELEETKSQLEVSILQEEMHKPLLTREQIAFFIYRFRKFDVTKREQLNDPTQFEQVDETCEFGGAVLYSESLGITAFFENAVPSKYETQKLKQLQFGIENEKIRQFEHECLIRLFQWSFLPPGKALDFPVCDEAFGCYKTQYRKRHLLEICQNASFLSTHNKADHHDEKSWWSVLYELHTNGKTDKKGDGKRPSLFAV